MEGYKRQLDTFKTSVGLPPDSRIELDRADLQKLQYYKEDFIQSYPVQTVYTDSQTFPAADVKIEPQPPTNQDARPLEMPEEVAIVLAFKNRLDLRVANGVVYDAQRNVVVRANDLEAELMTALDESELLSEPYNKELFFDDELFDELAEDGIDES